MNEHTARKVRAGDRKLKEGAAAGKIITALKLVGFVGSKIVAGPEQTSGLSDVIACAHNGRFVSIEVKILMEYHNHFKYTDKQINRLRVYRDLGALALGVGVLAYEHNISVVDTNLDGYSDEVLENWKSFAYYVKTLAEQKSALPK